VTNIPSLDDIVDNPFGLTKLDLDTLLALQGTAAEQYGVASAAKAKINDELANRFQDQITQAYIAKGEDTGSVDLTLEGGFTAKVNRSKKTEYDQGALSKVVEEIRASGDDPSEYVKVTYEVAERNYKAWPTFIRKLFEPARTLKVGDPKVVLSRVSV